MTERAYDGTLEGLFSVLDELCRAAAAPGIAKMPGRIRRGAPAFQGEAGIGGMFCPGLPDQPELFSESGGAGSAGAGEGGGISGVPFPGRPCEEAAAMLSLFEDTGPSDAALSGPARSLYAVSADAFDAFVCAWMSELPIEAEIVRYGCKVLAAAREAAAVSQAAIKGPLRTTPPVAADWTAREEARIGAAKKGRDRGDPDVRAVLGAAYKVNHEIDRMRGFLRFSPDDKGAYLALCAPDHFVLPALAPHFTRRFGGQEWAIIDEKRRLCLSRLPGEPPRLLRISPPLARRSSPIDDWEDLWRHYHRTINNESRNNPRLQRQFMPERYWKYLPELDSSSFL